MHKFAISDAVEFAGEWHLPTNERDENAIAGTLSWSLEERATLRLHSTFKPVRGAVYGDETHEYQVVHGTTTSSQYVTMLESSRAGSTFHFGPAGIREPERLVSSLVVVGAHVEPTTLYQEIRVRIPGLEMWIGRVGMERSWTSKTPEQLGRSVYTFVALPEEVTAVPSVPLTLGWGIDRSFGGRGAHVSVATSACLRVAANQPQDLDWFFDQLQKATTLLSFLAGAPMAPDHISATLAIGGAEVNVLVALREAKRCTHKEAPEFFMLRENMGVTLEAVFAKWFEVYESVGTPSKLALSILSSEGLWLHVHFLSLMQALEGFHRGVAPGLYMGESEYEVIRQTLASAIPKSVQSSHRDSLKSRIKYGNEISLRKRLDELAARLPLPVRTFVLGSDGSIPRAWVDTRNYYTHWDETLKDAVLDGSLMYRAIVRMRHLVRALYLDLVGIPQDAILKALKNGCRDSQQLMQLNNSAHRVKHLDDTSTVLMHISTASAEGVVPQAPDLK